MVRPPYQIWPGPAWPLFGIQATRALEAAALSGAPAHALMQRAGVASARLALALQPHARTIWIAAGPGNNGGDGMEAALHLQRWGKRVVVTRLGDPESMPADAGASFERASQAGVQFSDAPPEQWDLCLDALLGIGATRTPDGLMARWIGQMGRSDAPVLSIDVPTGLHAETGAAAHTCVKATATLCLLTLKPGLFTADGRDASGQIWLDELQSQIDPDQRSSMPTATLAAAPQTAARSHASHKGSFGDVAVVGGAPGMNGAALLAAMGALHGGAGRVYLCALDHQPGGAALGLQPELMQRQIDQLDLRAMCVVCGCGGGDLVRNAMPRLLSGAAQLVLDADALNALSADPQLQIQLRSRAGRNLATVLTPHPLEAARLLASSTNQVQCDRLAAARQLARDYQCTVVLKGSGTVVAAPDHLPAINPTGNPRLATAGTGDVLAGMIGAELAAGLAPFDAACAAVYRHGAAADQWAGARTLTASGLARSIARAASGGIPAGN